MDIEKLIERLNAYSAEHQQHGGITAEAADAISTLQAENEKLRVLAELGNTRAKDYRVMRDRAVKAEAENEKLRDELESVRAERNAAVDCCSGYCASCLFVKDCAKHDMNDAAPTRWYYGDCEDWEWRGQKED